MTPPKAIILETLGEYPGGGPAARAQCPHCASMYLARLARLESGESYRCPTCYLESRGASESAVPYRDCQPTDSEGPELKEHSATGKPASAMPCIVGEAGKDASGKRLVLARCRCKNTWTVRAGNLLSGHSKRCPSCATARRRALRTTPEPAAWFKSLTSHTRTSGGTRRVLAHVARCADEHGNVSQSTYSMARECGVNVTTVRKAVTGCALLGGWLVKVSEAVPAEGQPAVYRLTLPEGVSA